MGLFRAPVAEPLPCDIRPDPDRPLVYVSLGTLQGTGTACWRGSRGPVAGPGRRCLSRLAASRPRARATSPRIGSAALSPQRAILERAQVCVTHAGMNTVMECLEQGVPMLALP